MVFPNKHQRPHAIGGPFRRHRTPTPCRVPCVAIRIVRARFAADWMDVDGRVDGRGWTGRTVCYEIPVWREDVAM